MDLWSKGLGKRVLSLALRERDSTNIIDDELVIEGVMHSPTFWDYAVTLDRRDVTEFLGLLQEPEAVRFVGEDEHRTEILRTALSSAVVFAARTLRMLVIGPPAPEPASVNPSDDRATHDNPIDRELTDGGT